MGIQLLEHHQLAAPRASNQYPDVHRCIHQVRVSRSGRSRPQRACEPVEFCYSEQGFTHNLIILIELSRVRIPGLLLTGYAEAQEQVLSGIDAFQGRSAAHAHIVRDAYPGVPTARHARGGGRRRPLCARVLQYDRPRRWSAALTGLAGPVASETCQRPRGVRIQRGSQHDRSRILEARPTAGTEVLNGRLSRRTVLKRATVLGLSAPMIASFCSPPAVVREMMTMTTEQTQPRPELPAHRPANHRG